MLKVDWCDSCEEVLQLTYYSLTDMYHCFGCADA
jgi:hypothetical protein